MIFTHIFLYPPGLIFIISIVLWGKFIFKEHLSIKLICEGALIFHSFSLRNKFMEIKIYVLAISFQQTTIWQSKLSLFLERIEYQILKIIKITKKKKSLLSTHYVPEYALMFSIYYFT